MSDPGRRSPNRHGSGLGVWAEVGRGAEIQASLISYWCEGSPIPRLSAPVFTALAGRALEPRVQADMALVFVGLQEQAQRPRFFSPGAELLFFVEVRLKDIHDKRPMPPRFAAS